MSVRVPAGVLALVATSWLLFTFYDRFWYPPDEGNYAHVAQRVLEGEVLNLEVQDIHPGYITFLNAAALRAFGLDLISLRYPLVFAGLLQALVLYLHFPRERPWLAALAATALTALGAVQFLNPTAHWYCLALVVLLIACLDAARNHRGWLLAVGLLIGTITLFRQLTGAFAGMGALTFLLWRAGDRGASGSAAAFGRVLVLAMVAVLGLYLATSTDMSGILLFNLWPLPLLARLLIRPQAPNGVVFGIAATISAGVLIAGLPLLAYHAWHGSLGAWTGDVGPAAIALTRLDFFDRSNYGALIVQALRQAATGGTWSTVVNGLYWATLPLLAAAHGVIVLRLAGRSITSTSAIAPL